MLKYQFDVSQLAPRASDGTGERRLMLATLEDAVRTLLGIRRDARYARFEQEDLEWITSADQHAPFAFERICDVLGIDADWLRGRVLDARGATH